MADVRGSDRQTFLNPSRRNDAGCFPEYLCRLHTAESLRKKQKKTPPVTTDSNPRPTNRAWRTLQISKARKKYGLVPDPLASAMAFFRHTRAPTGERILQDRWG